MNKKSAIKIITENFKCPIISANGHISRNLFEINDHDSNFYMIGSMGLASSIALGVALKNKENKIIALDGDGNILMNLGSLTTIGSIKPENLIHIILDNGIHESTGGQPTNSNQVHLDRIAKAANIIVYKVKTIKQLKKIIKIIKTKNGPVLILIKINHKTKVEKRIDIEPKIIKQRFRSYLEKSFRKV